MRRSFQELKKFVMLVDAVIKKDVRTVAKLIKRGVDVNGTVGHLAFTPLHYAARYNSVECADLLIFAGARIEKVTVDNRTVLEMALKYCHIDMLELLMSHIMKLLLEAYQSTVIKIDNDIE